MTVASERTPLTDVHAHFLTPRYVQAAQDAGTGSRTAWRGSRTGRRPHTWS
ncbi:hypothetical protein SRB17_47870 [Streptomyces sp. RB17]|uniref:hypothetical protein n=1 Tax=Streptomyces sp. RB17 TaxID=2585197 RepID=UPI0012979803|nr:hypothetical protein [Streptomyces sp. RB17]MQY36785.1 hypothetical protein [Streptomyces sp. RB17]